jgi:hypothetical protein
MMNTSNLLGYIIAVGLPALLLTAAPLKSQTVASNFGLTDASVNSEVERYLRALQVAGLVPLHPWSVRGFSHRDLDHLQSTGLGHPWAGRYPLDGEATPAPRLGLIRPESRLVYNSAFPYGRNDGALWAGRGVAASVQSGVSARYGPFSIQVAPVLYWVENRGFSLMENGEEGDYVFAHPIIPRAIDLPQRMGDQSFGRVDPGQSTVRIDVAGVAVAVSNAHQHWGPAVDHPILLGSNAPGFLHALLGTSTPVNVGVGRVHGRVLWGTLEQSEYSPVPPAGSRRFMTGMVGVFTPNLIPGLEIGAARFFHHLWPAEGLTPSVLTLPLVGLLKSSLEETGLGPDGQSDVDNQLASVFARWVLPRSGVEAYVEYARIDHAWDLLDLLLEPDHAAGYLVGARKVWQTAGRGLVSARAEILNTQPSHLLRVRPRHPSWYNHSELRQGHTHRGQVLGSAAGFGGGGSVVAADYYFPRGRWSAEWSRSRVKDRWDYLHTGTADRRGTDVMHGLAAEALLVVWRGMEATGGVGAIQNLNRNFHSDAFNLNGTFGLRFGF